MRNLHGSHGLLAGRLSSPDKRVKLLSYFNQDLKKESCEVKRGSIFYWCYISCNNTLSVFGFGIVFNLVLENYRK